MESRIKMISNGYLLRDVGPRGDTELFFKSYTAVFRYLRKRARETFGN